MMRHATRGLVLLALLALVASGARAQNASDSIEVRNRKDGTVKTHTGLLKVTPAGFQVFTGEKFDKAGDTFAPDDIVRVTAGDVPGVDRAALDLIKPKEKNKTTKDYTEARDGYKALIKPGLADRSKRYLEFKVASLNQKLVDDLEPGKEWQDQADKAASDWKGFIADYKAAFGWELWPAVRSLTRLQIERGKYEDAAISWGTLKKAPELPPEAKFEAALQEIDLQVRSKAYPSAALAAAELQKTATGAKKERLAIYELAAKAGSDGKPLEGVDGIKAAMEKTKDPSVHATGYAMMGELYLAGGKPRDAMWMFLWVETVVNQDKDEVFKALTRLAELFEAQMDGEQVKKYREKIKRYRGTF